MTEIKPSAWKKQKLEAIPEEAEASGAESKHSTQQRSSPAVSCIKDFLEEEQSVLSYFDFQSAIKPTSKRFKQVCS